MEGSQWVISATRVAGAARVASANEDSWNVAFYHRMRINDQQRTVLGELSERTMKRESGRLLK